MAGGVGAAPREGEGADQGPRRPGRSPAADAVAPRREAVRVRGAGWQAEPDRPLPGTPAAGSLPGVLRARRVRLARARLPRLLDGGRPRRKSRPPECP